MEKQIYKEERLDERLEGFVRDDRISTDKHAKLKLLERYDLSFITKKLVTGNYSDLREMPEQAFMLKQLLWRDVTLEYARKLESDFKKWSEMLILEPEKSFAPLDRKMDMFWHLFILHTKEYGDFCNKVFGHYVGHAPVTENTKDSVSKAGNNTRAYFNKIFGYNISRLERKEQQDNSEGYCAPDGCSCDPTRCQPDTCIPSCQA